jgi:hypothetical protein
MTMFSMKPKFNLAEFLAVPAPKGSRSRSAGRRGMQFRPAEKTEEAAKPTPSEDPGATE